MSNFLCQHFWYLKFNWKINLLIMIWSLQFRMTISLIFENPILFLYSVAYHLVLRRCTRNKVLNNVYLVIQRVSNALDLIKLIVSRVIPVTSWLMGNAKRVVHKVWNLLIFSMQSLNSWSNNWSLNVWNRGVLLPKKPDKSAWNL